MLRAVNWKTCKYNVPRIVTAAQYIRQAPTGLGVETCILMTRTKEYLLPYYLNILYLLNTLRKLPAIGYAANAVLLLISGS